MLVRIANVLAGIGIMLLSSACIVTAAPPGGLSGGGGSGGGSGSGSGNGSSSSGAGASFSWDDGPPGGNGGPIADFKTFRSGCGEQLWGRFIPRRDFTLNELYAKQGLAAEIPIVLEQTRFATGNKTVLLLTEQGGFHDNLYTFRYSTTDASGLAEKGAFQFQIDEEPMFRWESAFTIASTNGGVTTPLVLNLLPTLTGKVEQVFIYDSETECLLASTDFTHVAALNSLDEGMESEIDVGTKGLSFEASYIVVVQGIDTTRRIPFYGTSELTLH